MGNQAMWLVNRLVWTIWLFGYATVAQGHEIKIPQKFEDLSLVEVSPNIFVAHGIQALPDKENIAG